MTYQYFHHRPEQHRDVAHWRGAKGGMRVLSLPSCSGWLRRQANDASYDFWPDLRIGAQLQRERRAAPARPLRAQAVYLMHKDGHGDWECERWHGRESGGELPPAANHAEHTDNVAAPGDAPRQRRSATPPPTGDEGATSFIIEIGAARAV
jgi:hypothetical protein